MGVALAIPVAPSGPAATVKVRHDFHRDTALVALVAMFVIASVFPINIGILGFLGAFGVGAFVLGFDDKEILAEFPTSIVLTIVGVTYFFGMAKKNGTIDLLVNACIRAVRGRVTVVPWVFFFAASVLTALGTFSPAAVALIAPAAMAFAARTRMSPLVMGIMTINGAHAGAFSPISVSGVLVRDIVESNGLSIAPWTLFLASYGINLLLSVLTVLGYAVLARVRDLEYSATGTDPDRAPALRRDAPLPASRLGADRRLGVDRDRRADPGDAPHDRHRPCGAGSDPGTKAHPGPHRGRAGAGAGGAPADQLRRHRRRRDPGLHRPEEAERSDRGHQLITVLLVAGMVTYIW